MSFRIALFCSYYRGIALLETLLTLQKRFPEIIIAGVATDDPTKKWTSPSKRIWQYSHTKAEEDMVGRLAEQHGIPVWRGRINAGEFSEEYTKRWMPDVCYMGVFGQKIPEPIWSYPLFGFYNFHACAGREWPSNVGGNPLKTLIANKETHGAVAMHAVDSEWDNGELIAFSDFFPIYPEDSIVATHKRTNPLAAQMMAWHIAEILGDSLPHYRPRIVKHAPRPAIRNQSNSLFATA
jgi:methionyl-tRNA formyltransferase